MFLLVGCNPEYIDKSNTYNLPPELKDCKVYTLRSSDGRGVEAVVCPDLISSTSGGKHKQTITVPRRMKIDTIIDTIWE